MKFSFKIAIRYLFGKKTINAINIITGISILGISIGAAALILILSVFNGFEDLIQRSFNAFNPDIKILPAKGKFIDADSSIFRNLEKISEIETYSAVLEEVAYLKYGNSRTVGIIKGVDERYSRVNNIDTLIISGNYKLSAQNNDFGVLGAGLANKLGVNPQDNLTPVSIYILSTGNSHSIERGYKKADVMPAGRFSVPDETEMKYLLVSIDLAQYLLGQDNKYSSIELKIRKGSGDIKKKLEETLGNEFIINDRMDQDAELRNIINIERWAAYAIVTLTLLLLTFNMIGGLWIIVIDKQKDISVLQAMGATKKAIRSIFIAEGILISLTGLIAGILIALVFYFLQKQYGIIGVSETAIIDSYPIKLRFFDFIIVSATVFIIGFLVSILPARKAAGIPAFIREE
ncbi:MAG: FtsX-like permease family protein [Deltaproteobacteria bacterium]